MKKSTAIVVLLLSLPALPGMVYAGPFRIALLADTTIQGSQRSFSRGSSSATPEQKGRAVAETVIPKVVAVQSEDDLLTKAQVWPVLRAAAAARGIALPVNVLPQDIQWSATAALLADNSRLQVREVHVDKLLNQVRFQLRFPSNPSAPAFSAWCPWPQQPQFTERFSAHLQKDSNHGSMAKNELVSVRRLATLHLYSQNSSAVLQVRPLQSGELGQAIHVRVPANGHTLVARIAGADLLDAVF